jgi:hypothetical protein
MTLENYLSDMEPTFQPGLEMDRKDNDGNYEPNNVVWKTSRQNANNRRVTVFVDTPRGRMKQSDAAELAGLPLDVFDNRRRKGWSMDRLFDPEERPKLRSSTPA